MAKPPRFITPVMILSMSLLLTGLPAATRSMPEAEKEEKAEKTSATKQTAPSHPARRPATRPAAAKGKGGGKKPAEKPLAFTDEDLKKFHSGAAASAPRPAPAPPSEDPLKSLHDKQERARWRQEKMAGMQQRILDLEGRLKSLQQKRLSIANPYVPRVVEGEAEKAEEDGLSGPERMSRVDDEIRKTAQELEAARQELASFLESNPE
ncbi:MAG TPA: hypothetical protein VGR67_04830 [Candidatus Polarisedimenticolia bacterium]|jgi:hypothetical protein|nr:hypothetical protein [Candidatus Polarisedimenticolia bacterium]